MKGAKYYQPSEKERDLNELVAEYAPLVKRIVNQIKSSVTYGFDSEDLLQAGLLGLLEAKSSYQSGFGTVFSTYAQMKIRYAIYECLRKNSGTTREISQYIKCIDKALRQAEATQKPLASVLNELGVTPSQYYRMTEEINAVKTIAFDELPEGTEFVSQRHDNPMLETEKVQLKSTLKTILSELSKREQMILALYYNDYLGFREIGELLQLTEARVSQIHAQLLSKLRTRLRCEKNPKRMHENLILEE